MRIINHLVYFVMLAVVALLAATACKYGEESMDVRIERKTCLAEDGVSIVYSAAGAGDPALVFIHGGLADRTFWEEQLKAFAGRHRVIAPDLPGHGESGLNRKRWGIPEFGEDVKVVIEAEELKNVIIFGNSLGGPVAIEAALLLPDRVLGVVGVDTFQLLDHKITPEETKQRADSFQRDFAGALKEMVGILFHADADPALIAEAERRMAGTSPEAAHSMLLSLAGYDMGASVRRLTVPLRAINGDLYPTDIEANRKIKADFDAVIMKHIGHYPMLERPKEFNEWVAEIVASLTK
ncbi:MAG: alpha/beta hydrolase [Candidatus Aminicenantes bacterium]|nr:MAG: alpha/beta hydrolase [Candidatus Aminicenantes bacterium]